MDDTEIAHKKQPTDNIIYLTMIRASAYEQKGKDTYTWIDPDHVLSLLDALSQAQKEAFALAADQCRDGYGDEYGNHRCKVVDSMRTQLDAAQKDAKDARALLRGALPHVQMALNFAEARSAEDQGTAAKPIADLRARIEAMLEKKV